MTRAVFLAITFVFTLIVSGHAQLAHAADPFTVSGVRVDAEGETAIEAQTLAISDGQLRAANQLIERMTIETDRQKAGFVGLDIQSAARLIRAMEIANEKRSASRYLGEITVAFNPNAVKQYLTQNKMTLISTQSRERLVVPILNGRLADADSEWAQRWASGVYRHALTPMQGDAVSIAGAGIPDGAIASAQAKAIRTLAQRFNTSQILIAKASESFNGVNVSLIDISIDAGTSRNMGTISAPTFTDAADAAVSKIENDWKAASVSTFENAVTTQVSVLYKSHAEWQRLQDVINTSAQISDAQLDALSKDGAMMRITYGGDFNRLGQELSYKGVKLEQDEALGTIMRVSGRR